MRASTHLCLIRHVKNRDGLVSAIGGNQVMSAGADVFMGCDRGFRYLLAYSRLMFHLGSEACDPDRIYSDGDTDTARDAASFERSKEIKRLKESLLPELEEPYRENIGRFLNSIPEQIPRPGDPIHDYPIELSGTQAAEAGLCMLTNNPLKTFLKLSGALLDQLDYALVKGLSSLDLVPRAEPNPLLEDLVKRMEALSPDDDEGWKELIETFPVLRAVPEKIRSEGEDD